MCFKSSKFCENLNYNFYAKTSDIDRRDRNARKKEISHTIRVQSERGRRSGGGGGKSYNKTLEKRAFISRPTWKIG